MTTITGDRYYDTYLLDIEGHAGYAPRGADIVCAAISALVCTVIAALEKYSADGYIYNLSYTTDKGNAHIQFDAVSEDYNPALSIYRDILCGFEIIEEAYPQNVRTKL